MTLSKSPLPRFGQSSSGKTIYGRTSSSRAIQYLLFAATGVGCALPGVLLPVLIPRWHLRDQQAGLAFFCSWLGSSVGALLVRGSLRKTVLLGGALVAIGTYGVAGIAGSLLWVWMSLFGAGMGLTMTSISLVTQRVAEERELIRLNFMWAAGSVSCPWIAVHALERNAPTGTLLGFGAFFLLLAVFAALGISKHIRPEISRGHSSIAAFKLIPLSLMIMVGCATGIEASAGAWLTTYATRLQHSVQFAIAAPTCLWAGLLLSRLLWSLAGLKLRPDRIVLGSLCLLAASTIFLVATRNPNGVLLAAFGIGFGLGPVYPLLLAKALRYDESGNIFFLAGLGSACLPWLTGAISQWNSSLRSGLLVPAAAAIFMLILACSTPQPPSGADLPK